MGRDRVPRAAPFARRTVSTPAAAGRQGRYRLTNLDSDNIRALLGDPAIEDTSGIDRSSMRTPDGAFPWLYLQLQRYMPLIRLRVLPGFVKTINAEPWLTDVTFFIPWFVLVVELLRRVTRGGQDTDRGAAALIIPTAALSIMTYQTLVRASPDSRLGDIVRVDGRPARMGRLALVDLGGDSRFVVQAIGPRRAPAHDCERVTYGRMITRVGGVGVDGPTNFVRRLSGVGALVRNPAAGSVCTTWCDRPGPPVPMAQ